MIKAILLAAGQSKRLKSENKLIKKFKNKFDYTMCAISGLAGLKPTIDAIKYSKTIACLLYTSPSPRDS